MVLQGVHYCGEQSPRDKLFWFQKSLKQEKFIGLHQHRHGEGGQTRIEKYAEEGSVETG